MQVPNQEILKQFQINAELTELCELKRGHINDSFRSKWSCDGATLNFIHQKINTSIFKDVKNLMLTIDAVLRHLKQILKDEKNLRLPQIIHTRSDALFFEAENGECWRTYSFIDDCHSIDVCDSLKRAEEAGKISAVFHRALFNLKPERINPAIAEFQNLALRLQNFNLALKKDEKGRAKSAKKEIAAAAELGPLIGILGDKIACGAIPLRVVHSDLKLNNILFDNASREAVCLVDYDTVMPGTVIYDFGDLARSVCLNCQEDEKDQNKISFNTDYFKALTRAYLKIIAADLLESELQLLSFAPKFLSAALALRFLADYLNGDTYFKTSYAEQNLVRARVQLKVLEDLDGKQAALEKIVKDAIQ